MKPIIPYYFHVTNLLSICVGVQIKNPCLEKLFLIKNSQEFLIVSQWNGFDGLQTEAYSCTEGELRRMVQQPATGLLVEFYRQVTEFLHYGTHYYQVQKNTPRCSDS